MPLTSLLPDRHERCTLLALGDDLRDLQLRTRSHGNVTPGSFSHRSCQVGVAGQDKSAPHPQLTIGPGTPHAPPYEAELARGVAALGFEEGRVFSASEFSGTNGIYFVWMTVPDPGTTGSSPDFASGPIIPNTLFPITITGVSTRNGKVFDAALANSSVSALDDPTLAPPFDVEGHSHFPFFIADATIFGPGGVGPAGNYKYTITMEDQQGNGWMIHTHFVVKKKG
jgi:hypothetical protein